VSVRLHDPCPTGGFRLEAALGEPFELALRQLDCLNGGVFVGIGGREPGRVVYDTCPVA
jgi:hypothetical protein